VVFLTAIPTAPWTARSDRRFGYLSNPSLTRLNTAIEIAIYNIAWRKLGNAKLSCAPPRIRGRRRGVTDHSAAS